MATKNNTTKTTTKTINANFKAAKEAAMDLLRTPMGCINVLNSASFKADERIKAALKDTGATKWDMGLMYRNENGRICKLTKRIDTAAKWAAAKEDGLPYVIIEGEMWLYVEVTKFTVNVVLDLVKNYLNAKKGIAQRKERAARKAAKAAKAAAPKAAKAKKADVPEFMQGLTAEQLEAMKAFAQTLKAAK